MKPDPKINLEYLRQPKIIEPVKAWLSLRQTDRKKECPFDVCSCCCELFGDDRFKFHINYDWFPSNDRIHPCPYYGPRKTYLAVKKAVEGIEKEER